MHTATGGSSRSCSDVRLVPFHTFIFFVAVATTSLNSPSPARSAVQMHELKASAPAIGSCHASNHAGVFLSLT